jgi:hypothetical protein
MRKMKVGVGARPVPPESKSETHKPEVRRMRVTKNEIIHEGKPGSKRRTVRMPATSRIPVSRAIWAELSGLKKAGETYDHLLEDMIEREKKHRLFEDMDRIEKRGKFVTMKW